MTRLLIVVMVFSGNQNMILIWQMIWSSFSRAASLDFWASYLPPLCCYHWTVWSFVWPVFFPPPLGNNKHRPFCNAIYMPKMWRSCFHHNNTMCGMSRNRANQTEEDSDSSCASWLVLYWSCIDPVLLSVTVTVVISTRLAARHLPVKCGFLCQLWVSKQCKDVLLWRSYLKNKAGW